MKLFAPGKAVLITLVLTGAAAILAVIVTRDDRTKCSASSPPNPQAGTRPLLPTPSEIARLPPDGGERFNRLVFEKSPYLLQHAANPVDWHPWGPEAFAKAEREDKPIFLSIGYSTCHWCHVMEHESFEDEEVARLLNAHFVPVKVDREERPDVDQIYMGVCIGLTGSGGWPLTIVMTPQGRPFFAGTYFPKGGAFGRPGLLTVLAELAQAWKNRRAEVLSSADEITRHVADRSTLSSGSALTEETLSLAARQLAARFDPVHGGFGGAPKFPSPHTLSFLLRAGARSRDAQIPKMIEKTLTAMSRGGIHDHLGGGFHRYSTDAEWLVPHFEKMLYDQAMLAIAYLEAFEAHANSLYGDTARGIFDYVLRDMTAPEGGFYCAEDADSEGLEGKFYVWRPEEILALLGPDTGRLFMAHYDVTPEGNFDEPHGPKNHSILREIHPLAETAHQANLSEEDLRARFAAARRKLFEARRKRIPPLKDDKILTDWNGLMIAALAKGSQVLGEPRYSEAARRAADFLLGTLKDGQGRLLHRYREGQPAILGHLDDYAFLAWGLLELYETTFDPRFLEAAGKLADGMLSRFWDEAGGAFYLSGADAEPLVYRPREIYDGAHPSGNSVAALVFLKLAHLTGLTERAALAERIFKAFSDEVSGAPAAHAQLMIALDFSLGPVRQIVIAGREGDPNAAAMIAACRKSFRPRQVVIFRPDGEKGTALAQLAPFTTGQKPIGGKATAYVCRDFACQAPTTDLAALRKMLRENDEK